MYIIYATFMSIKQTIILRTSSHFHAKISEMLVARENGIKLVPSPHVGLLKKHKVHFLFANAILSSHNFTFNKAQVQHKP